MRTRLAVPFLAVLVLAATGCDLVSDPEGPRPEDFEVQEDAAEVQTAGEDGVGAASMRQDVAAPLSTARGGITLSINAPR
jgi:hypothetical protein